MCEILIIIIIIFLAVHMANMVACAQLDRIEKSFPIITKPTEEVNSHFLIIVWRGTTRGHL